MEDPPQSQRQQQQLAAAASGRSAAEFLVGNLGLAGFGNGTPPLFQAVKECVDNSIDAGATLIRVTVSCLAASALQSSAAKANQAATHRCTITVEDDGSGMAEEDVATSVASLFATSKADEGADGDSHGRHGIGLKAAILYAQECDAANAAPLLLHSTRGGDPFLASLRLGINTAEGGGAIVMEATRTRKADPAQCGTSITFTISDALDAALPRLGALFERLALLPVGGARIEFSLSRDDAPPTGLLGAAPGDAAGLTMTVPCIDDIVDAEGGEGEEGAHAAGAEADDGSDSIVAALSHRLQRYYGVPDGCVATGAASVQVTAGAAGGVAEAGGAAADSSSTSGLVATAFVVLQPFKEPSRPAGAKRWPRSTAAAEAAAAAGAAAGGDADDADGHVWRGAAAAASGMSSGAMMEGLPTDDDAAAQTGSSSAGEVAEEDAAAARSVVVRCYSRAAAIAARPLSCLHVLRYVNGMPLTSHAGGCAIMRAVEADVDWRAFGLCAKNFASSAAAKGTRKANGGLSKKALAALLCSGATVSKLAGMEGVDRDGVLAASSAAASSPHVPFDVLRVLVDVRVASLGPTPDNADLPNEAPPAVARAGSGHSLAFGDLSKTHLLDNKVYREVVTASVTAALRQLQRCLPGLLLSPEQLQHSNLFDSYLPGIAQSLMDFTLIATTHGRPLAASLVAAAEAEDATGVREALLARLVEYTSATLHTINSVSGGAEAGAGEGPDDDADAAAAAASDGDSQDADAASSPPAAFDLLETQDLGNSCSSSATAGAGELDSLDAFSLAAQQAVQMQQADALARGIAIARSTWKSQAAAAKARPKLPGVKGGGMLPSSSPSPPPPPASPSLVDSFDVALLDVGGGNTTGLPRQGLLRPVVAPSRGGPLTSSTAPASHPSVIDSMSAFDALVGLQQEQGRPRLPLLQAPSRHQLRAVTPTLNSDHRSHLVPKSAAERQLGEREQLRGSRRQAPELMDRRADDTSSFFDACMQSVLAPTGVGAPRALGKNVVGGQPASGTMCVPAHPVGTNTFGAFVAPAGQGNALWASVAATAAGSIASDAFDAALAHVRRV